MDFIAYLHGFRKTVMGENIISLSVDSTFSKSISDVMEIDAGVPLIVRIEIKDIEEKEPQKNQDTKDKFRKTMHVKIRKVAEKKNNTEDDVKDQLKKKLIEKKIIEKSTTELDIKGYAIACNILDDWLK